MRITGLDLATRLCGWTSGDGRSDPELGVWEFPPEAERFGAIGWRLWQYLELHHSRFAPELVMIESPLLIVSREDDGRTDDLLTLRKLYGMPFVVHTWCAARGIPCKEASVQAVKSVLTGDRFAAKDDMVAACLALGLAVPEGPGRKDACDGFGVWSVGMREYSPEAWTYWDGRIRSLRGALL